MSERIFPTGISVIDRYGISRNKRKKILTRLERRKNGTNDITLPNKKIACLGSKAKQTQNIAD